MRIGSFLVALGIVSLSATRLAAQTCSGAASFSAGPMRVGAGLSSGDGVKSYGVSMAVGSKVGPFASGQLARGEYSDIDANATLVGLSAGYAMDVDPTVQFCPTVSLQHQSGPNVDLGGSSLETSATGVGLGGSLGGTVPVSPTLDVVPFVGAAFVISHVSATLDGESASDSQNYGEINVGAGFILNKTLTLQPSIAIPVGLDGAKSSFSLVFAFNFGSPKH